MVEELTDSGSFPVKGLFYQLNFPPLSAIKEDSKHSSRVLDKNQIKASTFHEKSYGFDWKLKDTDAVVSGYENQGSNHGKSRLKPGFLKPSSNPAVESASMSAAAKRAKFLGFPRIPKEILMKMNAGEAPKAPLEPGNSMMDHNFAEKSRTAGSNLAHFAESTRVDDYVRFDAELNFGAAKSLNLNDGEALKSSLILIIDPGILKETAQFQKSASSQSANFFVFFF